jgi:retron-type reverse transcriptase
LTCTPSQFGFRKNESTNDAIATIIENIIENHDILTDKLYKYGVRGIPHKLIESYLRKRTQHIKIAHTEGNQMKEYLSRMVFPRDQSLAHYSSSYI